MLTYDRRRFPLLPRQPTLRQFSNELERASLPELDLPRLIEVAERIFAYVQPDGSWSINNTGSSPAKRSVVSIDACSTQRRTRAYLDAIASVTRAPVTTLRRYASSRRPHLRQLRVRRRDDHRPRTLPRRGDQRGPARQHRDLEAGRVGDLRIAPPTVTYRPAAGSGPTTCPSDRLRRQHGARHERLPALAAR